MLQLNSLLLHMELWATEYSHFFHIKRHKLWIEGVFLVSLSQGSLSNLGRPRPAVKGNTRACRADDLQRSQPWKLFSHASSHSSLIIGVTGRERKGGDKHANVNFTTSLEIFKVVWEISWLLLSNNSAYYTCVLLVSLSVVRFVCSVQVQSRMPNRPASSQPVPILSSEEMFPCWDAQRRYQSSVTHVHSRVKVFFLEVVRGRSTQT